MGRMTNANRRFHAFDSLRGIMMLIGVCMHIACGYTNIPETWWYTEKNTHWLFDFSILFFHVFRLPIFFVMAGAGREPPQAVAASPVAEHGYHLPDHERPSALHQGVEQTGTPTGCHPIPALRPLLDVGPPNALMVPCRSVYYYCSLFDWLGLVAKIAGRSSAPVECWLPAFIGFCLGSGPVRRADPGDPVGDGLRTPRHAPFVPASGPHPIGILGFLFVRMDALSEPGSAGHAETQRLDQPVPGNRSRHPQLRAGGETGRDDVHPPLAGFPRHGRHRRAGGLANQCAIYPIHPTGFTCLTPRSCSGSRFWSPISRYHPWSRRPWYWLVAFRSCMPATTSWFVLHG